VTEWHDTFHAPVWITEFAFHDFNGGTQLNAKEISTALAQCQAFLQASDFVERYAFVSLIFFLLYAIGADELAWISLSSRSTPSTLSFKTAVLQETSPFPLLESNT